MIDWVTFILTFIASLGADFVLYLLITWHEDRNEKKLEKVMRNEKRRH